MVGVDTIIPSENDDNQPHRRSDKRLYQAKQRDRNSMTDTQESSALRIAVARNIRKTPSFLTSKSRTAVGA